MRELTTLRREYQHLLTIPTYLQKANPYVIVMALLACLFLSACVPDRSVPPAKPKPDPPLDLLYATAAPHPADNGTIISLSVLVRRKNTNDAFLKLPPDQQFVVRLDGTAVPTSCYSPDDCFRHRGWRDVFFVADLRTNLSDDYYCSGYLHEVFKEIVAAFRLVGDTSADSADFRVPGLPPSGKKYDQNWPANSLLDTALLPRVESDLASLAVEIGKIGEEVNNNNATEGSNLPILVLIRWQSQPLDNKDEHWNDFQQLLKKVRAINEPEKVPVPVFLFVVGRPGAKDRRRNKGRFGKRFGNYHARDRSAAGVPRPDREGLTSSSAGH